MRHFREYRQEISIELRPKAIWILKVVSPAVVLITLLFRFGLDAPLIDEWSFVDTVVHAFTHQLTFNELYQQHNDHRLFFPRIVIAGLAVLTGWNIRAEQMANVVVAAIGLAGLLYLARRGANRPLDRFATFLAATLSILVFSLNQWENWLWGMQICIFLNVAATIWGLALTGTESMSWPRLGAVLSCGTIATFSFASGLAFWPLILAIMAVRIVRYKTRMTWFHFSAAVAWSSAVITAYFSGFRTTPSHIEFVERHPVTAARCFFTYLATPVASFAGSAWPPRDNLYIWLAGFVGIVLLTAAFFRLWHCRPDRDRLIAVAAIAAYAVSSAALTTIGRADMGVSAIFASRYITISSVFWLALMILMSDIYTSAEGWCVAGAKIIAAAVAGLSIIGSFVSMSEFKERHDFITPAIDAAREFRGRDLWTRLHPEIWQIDSKLGLLWRYRLSFFRHGFTRLYVPPPELRALSLCGQSLVIHSPDEMKIGSIATVRVSIVNPTIAAWPAFAAGTPYAIDVSYHWLRNGRIVVFDGLRTAMPRELLPGDQREIQMAVAPPPRPGRYLLRVSLVQEGVRWFDRDCGGFKEAEVHVK
jgi:hypothetical protein